MLMLSVQLELSLFNSHELLNHKVFYMKETSRVQTSSLLINVQ